jgi:hypothetical protein
MHQSRKKERHRRGQRVATREVGGQLRAQQPRIAARDHDPAALTLQPVELDFGSLDVFSGVMVVSKPFAKKMRGRFRRRMFRTRSRSHTASVAGSASVVCRSVTAVVADQPCSNSSNLL